MRTRSTPKGSRSIQPTRPRCYLKLVQHLFQAARRPRPRPRPFAFGVALPALAFAFAFAFAFALALGPLGRYPGFLHMWHPFLDPLHVGHPKGRSGVLSRGMSSGWGMSARGGLPGGKTTGGWSEELSKIAAAGRLFGSTASDSTLRFFRIRVACVFSLGTGNSTWSTCGVFSSWSWFPFPVPLAFLGGRPRPRPFPPRPLPAAGAGSGLILTTRTGPGAYFSHLAVLSAMAALGSTSKSLRRILLRNLGPLTRSATCNWLTDDGSNWTLSFFFFHSLC